MIVERKWIRTDDFQKNTSQISYVDIWDGGLYKYERWPNDVEQVWEVLEREVTEDGFIERLRSIPTWKALGLVLHQERLMVQQREQHFDTPGWRVLLKPSSPSSEGAEGEGSQSSPHVTLESKNTTSYEPSKGQAKPQAQAHARKQLNAHRTQNRNGNRYAPLASLQPSPPQPLPQQQQARQSLPAPRPQPRPSQRPQPAAAPIWHDETT